MKQCKDCKHQNALEIDGYTACPFMKICQQNDRNMYQRVWWKFWAPKMLLITLALVLGGCVTVHVEREPDGTIYARYERCIFSQSLEGVEIDLVTGKATIMKQQSDAEGVARSIARGFAEGVNPVK